MKSIGMILMNGVHLVKDLRRVWAEMYIVLWDVYYTLCSSFGFALLTSRKDYLVVRCLTRPTSHPLLVTLTPLKTKPFEGGSKKWSGFAIVETGDLTSHPDNICGTVPADRNPIAGTYPNKEEGLGRVGSLWGFTFAPLSPPSPLHRIALHSTIFNCIQLYSTAR